MKKIEPQEISGLILAGGRGSRMNDNDKGLQEFRGHPLIWHIKQRFAPQIGTLLINANRHLTDYALFAATILPDHALSHQPFHQPSQSLHNTALTEPITDYAGPLAGIEAGLSYCQTPYLATVPCDSPFLPLDLIEKLSTALLRQNADIAVAICNEMQADGTIIKRNHPVFSLMKVSVLASLRDFLNSNGRKVRTWHASLNVAEVVFSESDAFCNFNTLQELRQHES
jgi:molybdopterin-guanine dinucleotide biosynthesis protein A